VEQTITAWNQATQTATITPGCSTLPDTSSQYEYYTSGFGSSIPDPANGVGSWTWCDSTGGGVWIDTPDRQGLLTVSLMGTGHVYYQASNIWSDGNEFEWELFSPKTLSQVASGAMDESAVTPSSIWIDPNLPTANSGTLVGGTAFDPTTNRLYVLIEEVWQNGVEWYPQVYVYQLAGPLAGATTTGGTGSGSTSGTGGSASAGGTTTASGSTGNAAPASGGGSHCGLGLGLSLLGALGLVTWRRRWSHAG